MGTVDVKRDEVFPGRHGVVVKNNLIKIKDLKLFLYLNPEYVILYEIQEYIYFN